ncbi:MAG: phosphoglucosamine mutase [Eubacterium sp.]|nr:phosphoglucosamine mutase [Eubacterium sp.]
MKYFGTDGFRGEANVNLTVEHAYKVGRFLGYYFQNDDHDVRVVIGKDTRLSGYMLETALASGLTASGADVYEIHVTPTPSVSYLVLEEGFDCGIMISASHNPYYDNGIKVINGKGHKLEPEVEEQIERYIDGEIDELPFAKKEKIGRCIDYCEGRERYKQHLLSIVGDSYEGKTVALDLSNGSASVLAKEIFETLGAQVIVRNDQPNGTNINRDCGSTHIESLQRLMYDTGADIGFAYDGDADRCLAVDDEGKIIDGDHILYICGKYLKEQNKLNKNTVVTTVMSNMGLYKAFDNLGIQYEQTAVGDKYVCENMMANDYSIGGEQSGHIIFKEHAVTGDGILTSLMLMEAWMAKGIPMSEMTKELVIYPQLLVNVKVKDKVAAREDEDVKAAEQEVIRNLGDAGRLLLRESGTEPLIRVMVEAETDEICKENVERIVSVLKEKNHVVE